MSKIVTGLLICLLFIAGGRVSAQERLSGSNLQLIQRIEDSLLVTADSMYGAYIPDARIGYSEQFARQLVRALRVPDSWAYPFEKLGGKINLLYPNDKSFRMFNWTIAPSDITRRYYGAIQMPSEQLKLYGLVDYSNDLGKGMEDSVLTGGRWVGCLYYRIMTEDLNGEKIYTLFGLNAGNPLSNKKILEPMTITDRGPVFGAPIFGVRSENYPTEKVKRFVLEYKKDVQVSMNWDAEHGAIFFDKLVSQVNDPGRKYTYVPSGEVDGFRWGNGQWNYIRDLVPVVPLKDGEAPVDQPR